MNLLVLVGVLASEVRATNGDDFKVEATGQLSADLGHEVDLQGQLLDSKERCPPFAFALTLRVHEWDCPRCSTRCLCPHTPTQRCPHKVVRAEALKPLQRLVIRHVTPRAQGLVRRLRFRIP